MSLTKAGQLLYGHCRTMIDEAVRAEIALETYNQQPLGRLKITCPEITGLTIIDEYISQFKIQYPKISIQLEITDAHMDLLCDDFDFAFRTGQLKDSALISRKIANVPRCLVASKDYLDSSPRLSHSDDLYAHQLLKHTQLDFWSLSKAGQCKKIKIKNPMIESSSLLFLLKLVLKGHGIALLPRYLAKDAIKRGTLKEVLSGWEVSDNGYYLIYPAGNKQRLANKLFKEFILCSDLCLKLQ